MRSYSATQCGALRTQCVTKLLNNAFDWLSAIFIRAIKKTHLRPGDLAEIYV